MKKSLALTLALLILLALSACGEGTGSSTTTSSTPAIDPANAFCFTYEGVKLIPGAAFDAATLPAVESAENPNCVGSGKFTTYYYDPAMELTTNTNGGSEVIYSIFITDANTPTDEGLYLGDDAAAVTAAYGDKAITEDGELLTYVKGNTHLVILLENGVVASIEYRTAE